MKKILPLIISVLFWITVLPGRVYAQFTVRPDMERMELVGPEIKDSLLTSPRILGSIDYSTEAMRRYERRRLRRERNTITLTPKLSLSQSTFTNWAKGGDDMFYGSITLYAKYTYKSTRFSLENTFNGALGLDIVDTIRFKSMDKFDILSKAQWTINDHWSYSGDIRLVSQFLKGYKSRRDKTYVSNFISPATLSVALGFTYKPFLKEKLNITISPLAGQAIIVSSNMLSDKGVGGIEKGRHFQPTIGPQLLIEYEKKLWKDLFSYRTDFTSFYNFKYSPNVVWNNYLTLKPLKFLSVDYQWFVIYDEGIRTRDMTEYMQYSAKLTVGLTFTFTNKK